MKHQRGNKADQSSETIGMRGHGSHSLTLGHGMASIKLKENDAICFRIHFLVLVVRQTHKIPFLIPSKVNADLANLNV